MNLFENMVGGSVNRSSGGIFNESHCINQIDGCDLKEKGGKNYYCKSWGNYLGLNSWPVEWVS